MKTLIRLVCSGSALFAQTCLPEDLKIVSSKMLMYNVFNQISDDRLGRGAATVFRDKKSGRIRDLEEERKKDREEAKKKEKDDEQFKQWGKG